LDFGLFIYVKTDELLNRFIAAPKQLHAGLQALQFTEGVVRLSKPITKLDAERLKGWSDRYPDQRVSLTRFLDENTEFILTIKI
jgi:hypothetical protein